MADTPSSMPQKDKKQPGLEQMAREQVKAVEEVALLSVISFAPIDPCRSSRASSVAGNSETPSSTGIQGPELTPRLVDDLL
ncbi:hypothetical protein NDU88_001325 [Pleurodeles waltl]|uniref:Uncharacterized protein n=1 Tax=Pleurodeles waltl TaxID=8319 RepID=A0AAV7NC32_PLEWA|nr:hypothetical protein NDU88_001325 [Pleurodeles waltl]